LNGELIVWTIYEAPDDFPDGFVTRPWTTTADGPVPGMAHLSATLDAAREAVPPGLFRLDRSPEDDPKIVESWL